MTNERIDHVAEALSDIERSHGKQAPVAMAYAFRAQVHATLAMVERQDRLIEQARIANLIAAGRHVIKEPIPNSPGGVRFVLRPDIASALGIQDGA